MINLKNNIHNSNKIQQHLTQCNKITLPIYISLLNSHYIFTEEYTSTHCTIKWFQINQYAIQISCIQYFQFYHLYVQYKTFYYYIGRRLPRSHIIASIGLAGGDRGVMLVTPLLTIIAY